ncbi:MAG: hypothetical protein P1U56_06935 [Saprospiraceae bacterium]|nr:hypothetical protein [Saprospiraceae bacterium]
MIRFKCCFQICLLLVGLQLSAQEKFAVLEVDSVLYEHNKTFTFGVNGVFVPKFTKKIQIPLSEEGFDTILFSRTQPNKYPLVTKFKEGEIYQLRSNTCSLYTLQPKKNPLQGMIRFSIENKTNEEFYVGTEYLRKVSSKQIDDFYYSPPSAMCPFSYKKIRINLPEDSLLNAVNFHFLHGELLDVGYNSNSQKMTVKLVGYVKSKKDYNYYYDADN